MLVVLGRVLVITGCAAAILVFSCGFWPLAVVGLPVLGMAILRHRRARQYMLLSTLAVAADRLMPLVLMLLAVPAFAQGEWAIRYACYPNITDAQKADGLIPGWGLEVTEEDGGEVLSVVGDEGAKFVGHVYLGRPLDRRVNHSIGHTTTRGRSWPPGLPGMGPRY